MQIRTTEARHEAATGLDARAPEDIASILHLAQVAAVSSLSPALPALATAAQAMADCVSREGRLFYAAAGSSGLMAAADAMELAGTYGIDPAQIRIVMAGGLPTTPEMPGDTEDGEAEARQAAADARPGDVALVLSASGSTPFALAFATEARQKGATVIGIANNPDTPLLACADHAICLPTPPEVIAGSTRMGAGSAQKVALNILSTLMGIALGHVHDGMMVNLRADNSKLRDRAARMVATIAKVDPDRAGAALDLAGGEVKKAVLVAGQGLTPDAAAAVLNETNGNLRAALSRVQQPA